ncbi:MAG: patatin-like phospholipase family protein [Acidobacteria bacterium]|nr:patatin-like phospholipase family protein [Acidobacteriota bacterium]
MARGSRAQHELYSPERPTAVVLSGTGVDGAYHAGVLEALHEAGVKIDLVAGRGVGALAAVLFALDGAAALWDARGFWRRPVKRAAYGLTWPYRAVGLALAVAAGLVASPLVLLLAAVAVWPLSLVAGWTGLDLTPTLAVRYATWLGWVFQPDHLAGWIARLVLLVATVLLGALAVGAAVTAARAPRRHRGHLAWRLLGAPVDSARFAVVAMSALWDLLRGGATLARPRATDLSLRLSELLVSGAGQPGHRDLLLTVHDLDARRDLVFGMIGGEAGRRLFPGATGPAARRAEAFDLTGLAKAAIIDVVSGALTLADLSDPHPVAFPADSYWRGEVHRLADRPASLSRLLEEAAAAGMEQAIIVTASPDAGGPHELRPARLDPRGRAGEWLAAQEAAAVRDAARYAQAHFHAVFVIRPTHNALTPLDLAGADDARSDRRATPADLVTRGHEDAHRLFIEPALGAAGERVGEESRGRS